MQDINKLRHSKMYIDLLSEGVDPITNEDINVETMRNTEIINCLKYVSEILNNRINQISAKERKKEPFFITEEQCRELVISDNKLKISEITKEINRVTELNETKKLQASVVNDWLESIGILVMSDNGSRMVTKSGNDIGITSELSQKDNGKAYYLNYYDSNAQSFIYDRINDLVAFANNSEVDDTLCGMNITFVQIPFNISIEEYLKQHKNKCFIMAVGSCDSLLNIGSYKAILYYNGKTKVFQKDNINTSSSNRCIIYGLTEAAKAIKTSTDIILLTSTSVGFRTRKSVNHNLCLQVIDILSAAGCNISVCDCKRGDELNKLVDSYVFN